MYWLKEQREQLQRMLADDTLPHAILLAGGAGLGKRRFAFETAAAVFGVAPPAEPVTLDQQALQVPDFHCLQPLEDKVTIGIDQVRALSAELALSAHHSAKLAIVSPADRMTAGAANALLKTLEEPAGRTILILVADDISRLPATIKSRCSVWRIRPPASSGAVQWLVEQGVEAQDAADALRLAMGAPLGALGLLAADGLTQFRQVCSGLLALLSGRAKPLQIAADWQGLDRDRVVQSLKTVIEQLVYPQPGGMRSMSGFEDYVMDSRDLFCYLDRLNRIRRMSRGSFDPELTIDSLLIPWTHALEGAYGATHSATGQY